MKARIKATGEIIEIADYATIVIDKCDSCGNPWGNPIEVKLEDIELIQEVEEEERNWQDVRERAAIAAMQSLIREKYDTSDGYLFASSISLDAVEYADALVKELKRK